MKHCAFCLRPEKMSGEHIWSDWIGRLFADYKGRFHVERGVTPETTTRWQSRSIDAKTNVVCAACNSGWMSELESEASATMSNMIGHGSGISLLPRGIASIAAFSFKTAVIVDCTALNRSRPFFSHGDRKLFATNLTIPKGVQIWLSTFRTKRLYGRYFGYYAKINSGHFKGFDLYVCTYVVGFLAIQLNAFRWNSIAKRPSLTPYFGQSDIYKPVSVPLWPPDGRPVSWPTPQYLTDESIEVFCKRWSEFSERI